MIWKSILKRRDGWAEIQAHMTEDRIMRPKRKKDHPLQAKRTELLNRLKQRLGEEPDDPEGTENEPKTYAEYKESEYAKYHKQWRDSPEMKEVWKIDDKIDFEYQHGVGHFQGQEPEEIRPYHGFKQPKFDEEYYRKKGYEPPKNKRHMKRD